MFELIFRRSNLEIQNSEIKIQMFGNNTGVTKYKFEFFAKVSYFNEKVLDFILLKYLFYI